MKRCFEKPSVVASKRSKNLREILIRAKVSQRKTQKRIVNGFRGCGELCHMCPFTPDGTTKVHKCSLTNSTYDINSPMNCKKNGVVYRITCKKCPNFVYIGETGRTIKQRFYEHHRDARNKDMKKTLWYPLQ